MLVCMYFPTMYTFSILGCFWIRTIDYQYGYLVNWGNVGLTDFSPAKHAKYQVSIKIGNK